MRVEIGPDSELHLGLHGDYVRWTSRRLRLKRARMTHLNLQAQTSLGWFESASAGEFTVCATQGVVHAVRWPALEARAWVADIDDFMFTLLCGSFGTSPHFERCIGRRDTRDEMHRLILEHRIENMIAAWEHPSCTSVLVATQRERSRIIKFMESCFGESRAATLGAKIRVVFPAVAPICPAEDVIAKWAAGPLRVVIASRDFAARAGSFRVELACRLADCSRNIIIHFVGDAPITAARRLVASGVNYSPTVSQREFRDLLSRAHVLVSPSQSERIGVTLIESAACGMVPVLRDSSATGHYREWYSTSDAVFVTGESVREYRDAVFQILDSRVVWASVALGLWERATNGSWSMETRLNILLQLYEGASQAVGAAMRIGELPFQDGYARREMTPEEMRVRVEQLFSSGTPEGVAVFREVEYPRLTGQRESRA